MAATIDASKTSSVMLRPRSVSVIGEKFQRFGDQFRGGVKARAVVEMVRVDWAEVAPGIILGGLKEQVAPTGRFEQARVIAVGNVPPCAVAVAVYVAD